MARIKRVVGLYPSTSGNTRIWIEFYDRGDMHFYMTPTGDLHIGKTHNEHTLEDHKEGYDEFLWAEKMWKKGNPEVVTRELNEKNDPERFEMAVALCLKLQNPIERKKVFQKAMALRKGTSTMKENPELSKKLNLLKKNIRNENKDKKNNQPAPNPSNQAPTPAKNPKVEAGNQKVTSPYGSSQIDKFKKRYGQKTA